jgi:hypothetical protein
MWPLWQERSHGIGLPFKKLVPCVPISEWWPELTGHVTPPRRRALTTLEQQQLEGQAQAWLAKKVVEISTTIKWVNNPVFVAKKDGSIRVCIDCRPANAVTRDFDWPLPRLQDLRYRTRGAVWFSRMDLSDAFFRISIPSEWRHLTAFESGGRRYQFARMPFGLKTAPSTFQRFMDHVLAEFFSFCFWYIDDVLVWASSLAELRQRVKQVKHRLRQLGNDINEKKSEYDKQGLLFAGMWIYHGGVGPNHHKVREVLALPCPRTKVDKQSALGLVSYLRDHIPLVSLLTSSLTVSKEHDASISEKEYELEWGRLLRHIRRSITTLVGWDEDADADLFTDASGTGVAAVLIQDGRIVALASRKLVAAETRYSTTDREHLSLKLAAEKFKVTLHRPRGATRVWNDHAALLNRDWSKMTPRQARTAETINQWIPRIQHVPGSKNPADYLSRWGIEIQGGQICV